MNLPVRSAIDPASSLPQTSRHLTERLLGGCAWGVLLAVPVLVPLGVSIPRTAEAQTTLQSTTQEILLANYGSGNPFTINAGTSISNNAAVYNGKVIYGSNAQHWTITNAGNISSSGNTAIRLNSQSTVTNLQTGTIATTNGLSPSIALGAGGMLTNFGTIMGQTAIGSGGTFVNSGITDEVTFFGFNGAVETFINSGTLVERDNFSQGGVSSTSPAVVINQGVTARIIGTKNGVALDGSGNSVFNEGTITGTGGIGVYINGGGTVTNQGTSAEINGVAVGYGSVTNSGRIIVATGNVINGNAVSMGSGTLYNQSVAAQISGAYNGVDLVGSGLVTNEGTIAGLAGNGIDIEGLIGGARVTVTNSGTASSIAGALNGVYAGNVATIVNSGTIRGTTEAGVSLGLLDPFDPAGSIVTNQGTASMIVGGRDGIVSSNDLTSITNAGTIIGSARDGIRGALASVVNQGPGALIQGAVDGIWDGATFASISINVSNEGTIVGTTGHGLYLHGPGSITNTGLISGQIDGVRVDGGPMTVTNSGLIQGTGVAGVGVTFSDPGAFYSKFDNTLTNSGTIIGAGGTAVLFGFGNDRLILQPGATIVGTVNGGSGSNTIEFASGTGTGSFSGLGTSSFTNFVTVVVDSGANWQFTGANTVAGNVALMNSGKVNNTGTLNVSGVFVDAGSLVNGGTLANNGTLTAAGILSNSGLLTNSGSIAGSVTLAGSGVVNNLAGGHITGTSVAVYGTAGSSGTITNAGTIAATAGSGISLASGGSVSNGGLISGTTAGIEITGGIATITNTGTIVASGTQGVGVLFTGSGSGTIDNSGTIDGGSGTAVKFAGGTNELIIESGGVLIGKADGSLGNNTLVFAGTGALTDAQIVGFQTVQFTGSTPQIDPNSTVDNASVASGSLTNQGTITGAVTVASGATLANNGIVSITAASSNSGSLSNSGTLTNGSTLTNAGTIFNSGTFINTGAVLGTTIGVIGGGTITNSGTIVGTTGTGVQLTSAGTLTNDAGGLIQGGQYGVQVGAGGTIVNAGTILDDAIAGASLGSGASLSNAATGTISGVTGIVFTGTGASVTNSGVIVGTGGVAVQFDAGVNTLTLASGSSLAGKIDGGGGAGQIELTGGGALLDPITNFGAGSALTIASGAVWSTGGDSWTIANTTNAGTLILESTSSPLKITGNFSQTRSGILAVTLNADGTGAQLQVTGTAALAGTVDIAQTFSTIVQPKTYTIVTASGGITGRFGTVTIGSPLLTPTLSYDADDAFVTLFQRSIAASIAGSRNQHAVAVALDAASAANPAAFAATVLSLDQLSAPAVRSSLDHLSGESHASLATTALIAGTQFVNQFHEQGVLARLGASGTPSGQSAMAAGGRQQLASLGGGSDDPVAEIDRPWGVWSSGYGQSGQIAGDGDTHRLTETVAGGAVGADYKLTPALRVGLGLGYGGTTFSLDDGNGRGQVDHTQVALYADYTMGPAYLDGMVGAAYGDGTTRRNVSLPGAPAQAAGHVTDTQLLGSVEAGYGLAMGSATVTPFAGLSFGTIDQDGFTETGAGVLDLQVHKQSQSSVKSTLGARLTADLPLETTLVTTDLQLGWAHEFAPTGRGTVAAFSGAPAAAFQVAGAKVPGDSALVGFGLATALFADTSVYLHYDGDLAGPSSSHAITAGFRFSW